MSAEILLTAIFIFCCRLTDVSLGTIKLIYIIQGRRVIAAVIGFFEVSIFLMAIAKAIGGIHHPISILAYSGGFATGTLLGITIEGKLSLGWAQVSVISPKHSQEIIDSLRAMGYGVTAIAGEGLHGPVQLVYSLMRRRDTREMIKIVDSIDKNAFVTISDSRHMIGGYLYSKRK
jgi:uncharacterized protein YebE (UPF0316 family)